MALRMTVATPSNAARNPFTADIALQIAWGLWFCMLVFPFIVFVGILWYLADAQANSNIPLAQHWFVASVAYMVICTPITFFYRSRLFRGYWHGHSVSPRDYLVGMAIVWLGLEIGGLLALTGCIVSRSLLPNLMPALVAFIMFTTLWPNGNTMIRPLMNERDPGGYEDPR